jgi:hypothetical protein
MLVDPEHYKGISFVRISMLPAEQRIKIRESFSRELIVKIVRDNTLINDCIIYDDYVSWFRLTRAARGVDERVKSEKKQQLVKA